MKLTPEDLQRIEEKKVANILRKIYTEKRTPTAREDVILHRAGVSLGEPAAGYVGTWDELAAALGKAIGSTVTRRAIHDWRHDPRYKPEIERRRDLLERADGRHCVPEWVRLMSDLGLKRGAASAHEENDPGNDRDEPGEGIIRPPMVGGSQAQWNLAIAALDHRKKENAVLTGEGRLLVAADLAIPLGAFLAALQSKFNQFPDMAARRVRGIDDEAECREHLRDEIDAIAADIQLGRYLVADAIATAVAAPLRPDLEALCAKLLFADSDRTALLDLAGAIAAEALRRIGSQAIADARRDETGPAVPSVVAESPPAQRASPAKETPAATATTIPERAERPRGKTDPKAKTKRARKPRPQPTPPPPQIDAQIVPMPKKKRRR